MSIKHEKFVLGQLNTQEDRASYIPKKIREKVKSACRSNFFSSGEEFRSWF
jgi:hypothetical protein